MNERIEKGNEMLLACCDTKQVMEKVLSNMIKTRPLTDIYYKPCMKQKGVGFNEPLGGILVDFNEIYPEAEIGDFAYFEFDIIPMHSLDVLINVYGEGEIEYNGKRLVAAFKDKTEPESAFSFGYFNIPINVKADCRNRVRVKCVKNKDSFGLKFNLSIKRYPGMWANDYLYWMRAVIGDGERRGEEGVLVSKLYKKSDTPDEITFKEYCPTAYFDFNKLSKKGNKAYVYTVCRESSTLCARGSIKQIFINGNVAEGNSPHINAGDTILIECEKTKDEWYLEIDDTCLYLPFVKSEREKGVNAVCLCGFDDKNEWDNKYLDFKTVMKNGESESFWRFADGSYLRIYLDSVFYGQWFYALMVGFYGIREAGDTEYFWKNMKFMSDYFDYVQYDARVFGMPAFMPRSVVIDNLDATGSMGMNLVDAYMIKPDESIERMIDYLENAIETSIPRFPDGTFYRISTMWADDTYMSVPFLVRLYKHKKDKKWLIEAEKQLMGFKKRLWMEDKKIISHIYYVEEGMANRVPWGRANGWVMWALSETLLYCEVDDIKERLLEFYKELAEGIISFQDESGMWRQVLDREDKESYPETSATAMFILSLARGINNGWLDDSCKECVKKAWTGLLKHSIDKDGNIYGVSMGSGLSKKAEYYFKIDTAKNDDHGTGVILAAAREMEKIK